ncbi:P-loop ATPase, Sll1717 family [Paraburkholderia phenoliruptrix]|uniref:P-loop ATPase, Sll1717 family n=1 Tax=Paraburkholderia phenoliruptrix TaxID=252970 RepID=UPI001C4F3CEA|nr:hypothetical protein [Paraburkholderia phenoliruptrix]MBW0449261.1 hypothetical protein [Paraburkholderia phenoliruptrix]MBW9097541.1 hypothetical protein [Paraburkholderia phenoliruptrix]
MNTSPGKRLQAPQPRVKFDDERLFGNDAADLENRELFLSYAVQRPELEGFLDADRAIQVTRAWKGEGKSGLLRLAVSKLNWIASDELVIDAIGPDHSPAVDSTDSDVWTRAWKKSLLKLVANEVGSRVNMAFTDDAISLVEEAESNGFKQRNFVSTIVDRLKSKAVPIERTRLPTADYEQVVKRYLSGRRLIWIVIDDVDQNFQNTERWRVKLGAFFTACRQIVSVIPELRIRTSVRPNVWAIIKREFEALSHIEQYVHDLSWSKDQFRSLLAARVRSYLQRTQQWDAVKGSLPFEQSAQELFLIALLFDSPMPWGGGDRTSSPHLVLWTLTAHRPRWLVELCKAAGTTAARQQSKKINIDHIKQQLDVFGRKRIEDTEAEFKSQCPQISEVLSAFSRQVDIYSTDELLRTINNRTMAANPTIVGIIGKPTDLDVAHFLFQIGFIAGRRDYGENQGYDHVSYPENPTLLKSRTNRDDGLRWEINPVFRDFLNLRSISDKRHTKSGRR